MKFSSKFVALCGVALLSVSSVTSAAIVSGSSNFVNVTGSLPAVVGNNNINISGKLFGFDEKQNVVTTSGFTVDEGSNIGTGVRISSHFIYFDPKDSPATRIQESVTFDGIVLGIITEKNTLIASAALENMGVKYDYSNSAVGLEGNNTPGSQDLVSFAGNSIKVDFLATKPGDHIRVITAAPVPVPAAVWFLGSGLLGLVGLRRKQQVS